MEKRAGAWAFSAMGIAVIIFLSVPCAAGPGGRDGGTGAPGCNITSPADGTIVRGSFEVRGTAANGSSPLDSVQVNVDGGPWRLAGGLENWTITMDISLLKDGNHTVRARATTANMSSAEASVNISVRNPGPAVSSKMDPVCPVFVIIIAGTVASVVLAAFARRRM